MVIHKTTRTRYVNILNRIQLMIDSHKTGESIAYVVMGNAAKQTAGASRYYEISELNKKLYRVHGINQIFWELESMQVKCYYYHKFLII